MKSTLMPKLINLGHFLGSKVNTNQEMEILYNLQPGFILEKTGIKERRYFEHSEDPRDLATNLAREMLAKHNIRGPVPIFGSSNPYGAYQIPTPTMEVAHKLGFRNCPVYHVNYGCGGYLGAMQFLHQHLQLHPNTDALLILTDWPSSMVDKYQTAVLFSDAIHVSLWSNRMNFQGFEMSNIFFENTLENPYALNVQNGFWNMDGRTITRFVRSVPGLVSKQMGIRLSDYDIVPHQPNTKLLETLERDYSVPFYKEDVRNFGNTTCAAMMIAFENFLKKKAAEKPILLMGFGDTESYGGAILQQSNQLVY